MRLCLTLSLCLLYFCTCGQKEKNHYIDPDKLSWDDYTGKIDSSHNYTAYTFSTIAINYKRTNGLLDSVYVWVRFINDSSYIKRDALAMLPESRKAYLFNHEKNHYLISIIYAKTLKKYIDQNLKMTDSAIGNLLNSYNFFSENNQLKYDDETNHALNTIAQMKWDSDLSNKMMQLKDEILEEYKQ